ncbi:hypothetical protein [Nitratireductor sp. GZWM139]|uniref:hypothetical protein n=1 Tax=Nitratireductor sp. GZWM139 TaxID=2950541 RepID=UPI0024BEAB52|nr:hypothetical protein [Nitratireductor sp. GZWM139]MDJ1465680.1 hypothetical protein [Nitratireductor sp. GZWM139]
MTEKTTHNGPAVDAAVALNLSKLKREKEAVESATGSYRATRKHVEGKGIHLKAADRALQIIKSGKKDEYLAETEKVIEYLYAFGDGIEEAQMSFDYLLNGAMPSSEKARMLGRNAGLRGDGHGENPYAPGSEQYQEWLAGHGDGARERALAEAEDSETELVKGDDVDPEFPDEEPAAVAAE